MLSLFFDQKNRYQLSVQVHTSICTYVLYVCTYMTYCIYVCTYVCIYAHTYMDTYRGLAYGFYACAYVCLHVCMFACKVHFCYSATNLSDESLSQLQSADTNVVYKQ